ncbi:MAG: leucine-rich repeat domain-containing protein [Oscillospiraceae bacterium]|nr:leucine-rich repeat domain-containing protein [Oscillospiraceae bacterium]
MNDYTGAAARLEEAVINMEPDELRELYKEIGYVDFSAKALGLACRFRGADMVKALCECGATFAIPQNEEAENLYHVYSGMKYENYRSNFAMYLLNITKQIKGACCCKGIKLLKQTERNDKKKLKQISDSERAEVLKYLCENAEKLSFQPSELLLWAIYARDDFIYNELKTMGVKISEKRINIMANGGNMSDMYWYEYSSLNAKLSDEDYLPVMERLAAELDGKQFHCTEKIFEITKKRFSYPRIPEFFFENFEMDKLNRMKILRGMIDGNSTAALSFAEKAGWLDSIKRRDDLIDYARKNKSVECTAWLLDFKNRTADFAAEQAKAEKKIERELNASPNSVLMLKKLWSYKKREQGDGLVITEYKGMATEVTVPETIGKSTVVEIGNGAFAGSWGVGGGTVNTSASQELMAKRRKITKVTLPGTIKVIGRGAFTNMTSLLSIEIPDSVEEIEPYAFSSCARLENIIVPGSVKRIGKVAFAGCKDLRRIKFCEGVTEIGSGMFNNDTSLEEIELPRSLKMLVDEETRYAPIYAIDRALTVTVICPNDSYAEKYCKAHGIKFSNI